MGVRYHQNTELFDIHHSKPALSNMDVFTNPIMKNAILTYSLNKAVPVSIQIFNYKSKLCVRNLHYLPNNPGGKPGENKVYWDGNTDQGQKVGPGKYIAVFFLHKELQDDTLTIRF